MFKNHGTGAICRTPCLRLQFFLNTLEAEDTAGRCWYYKAPSEHLSSGPVDGHQCSSLCQLVEKEIHDYQTGFSQVLKKPGKCTTIFKPLKKKKKNQMFWRNYSYPGKVNLPLLLLLSSVGNTEALHSSAPSLMPTFYSSVETQVSGRHVVTSFFSDLAFSGWIRFQRIF